MAEDWRITVDFDDEGDGTQLVEWLSARQFASEERDRLGGRVAVSRDGACVFLYADTEQLARDADGSFARFLSSSARQAGITLEQWHPVEQEWKDAGLTASDREEIRAEHARQQAREPPSPWPADTPNGRSGSLSQPRGDRRLADRLGGEGIPVTRRSTFLLVGAVNEDEATASRSASATRFRRARASRSSRAAPWSGRSADNRSPSSEGSAADNVPPVGYPAPTRYRDERRSTMEAASPSFSRGPDGFV